MGAVDRGKRQTGKESPRSAELQARIDGMRKEAREHLVKDGTVQFRLDAEMMDLLLRMAEHKRTPCGVLSRMWVVERLREEAARCGIAVP